MTATLTASPNASTSAGDTVSRPVRRGDETASEFFARVLSERGIPDDGSVAIWVTLHHRNTNGQAAAKIEQVPWSDFDEGDFGQPPGTYVLTLKSGSTGRYPIATAEYRIGAPGVLSPGMMRPPPPPPPAPPAAGGQGSPSPIDPIALFSLILQQNQAAMAQQQALTNTLLEVALKPQQPRSMFEDLVQLDELLERRASRKGDGDGSAIADAIREVGPGLLDVLKKRPAPAPSAPGAAPARALPARPAAPTLPPPAPSATPPAPAQADSPESAMLAALDRLGGLLRVGEKIKGDPSLYADLVSDAFESEGLDLEGTLDLFDFGELASMLAERFGIDAEWLQRVEVELRQDETDAGVTPPDQRDDTSVPIPEDPPFEPDAPAAPSPTPKKKGKAKQ